uniref:G-protein coupled receptors family 1 profile domain-containing protein n=1 Tax=Acrobeloides nanus TaxID=290746 RepID=A0A914CXJ1_9BILA
MRLMRVREMMNLSSAGQIETQRLTSGSCDSPAPLSPTKNQPFRYPKLERHTSMIARSPTNSSLSPTSPTRKTSLTQFQSLRQHQHNSLPRKFTQNGDSSGVPTSPGSVRLSGAQFSHPVHFQRKSEKRPRMYIFLIWLTFWDTAILLGALLLYSIPTVLTSAYQFYATLFPLFYMFCNGALTASVWLTLAFMVDRYKKVTKPFHKMVIAQNSTNPMSETRIHLFMLLLSFLAMAFALPRFFEITVDVDTEADGYSFMSTVLSESHITALYINVCYISKNMDSIKRSC